MNTNEPREPASTEGAQLGNDERVEVLVEDLFIEEYPAMPERGPERRRALVPARRKMTRGKGIALGAIALGVIALVGFFFEKPAVARRLACRVRGAARGLVRRYV